MEKQNFLQAVVTFCKDLPKAAFICHVSMLGSIGIFILIGSTLTKKLAVTGQPNLQSTGMMITIELIVTWFAAFALAVKMRPIRQEDFCLYPPRNMLGGAFVVSIFLVVILGTISGHIMGFSLLKSVLYGLPCMVAIPFLIIFLFVPTIPATHAAVKMKRDPTLAIADSYRNTWLFSALAVLVIGLFLQWIAGDKVGLTPYFVTINNALIMAVSYTGFASGYYP